MNGSIVINTYNRPGALARCLAALAAQPVARDFEVIIADDGGATPLDCVVQPFTGRLEVRLLRLEHGGRSAARNAGVRAARGGRIVFLGDDVLVGPGCLERHGAVADSWTALAGPYPWRGLSGSPPFRHWAEPNPREALASSEASDFIYFTTGNLSMDRAVFLELGGFDERFKVYGWEDLDLGLRFIRAGGRLAWDAEAAAVHEHPGMTRAQLWRREYELGQTAWQFWHKWAEIDPVAAERARCWGMAAQTRGGAMASWPAVVRRRLGKAAVALLDRIAPASALNASAYERLIYAHRTAGAAAAMAAADRDATR